jgi:DNA-binding response OmpR family regulator
MPPQTILVIEDDSAIRRGVLDTLAFAGYTTLQAGDGETGTEMALRSAYDLLLLDLVLPRVSGFDILKRLRETRPGVPVIILSARGEENDRVRGLKLGADDYVVKPFSVRELLARVEAVLRRSPERPPPVEMLAFAGGEIDLHRDEIRHDDGTQTALSVREAELLRYLAANRGRCISRDEILQRVWRVDPRQIETRTVDVHVAALRQKLRDESAQVLQTQRGKGYLLHTP